MGIQQTTPARIVLGIFSLALAGYVLAAGPLPNLDTTLTAQLNLVAAQPDDAEAQNDLGNLLVLAGRFEEAEQAYAAAVGLAPASTLPRFNLGMLLQQTGRSREAAQEFRHLLEIDDRHARAHYQLGMLQEARNRRAAALESYARAFALDPELTFPRQNPHILDNRLATEAMLMSRQFYTSPGSEMPRLYGEGERIAKLMLEGAEGAAAPGEAVGKEAADEGEEPGLEAEAGREEGAPAARRRPARGADLGGLSADEVEAPGEADRDDEESDDEEDGKRQLTPADLITGSSVGQVVAPPAGGVSRRTQPTRPGADRSAAGREEIIRQRLEASDRSRRTTATGSTPASPRYRPASRFSTGRLELRLLPEEPEEGLASG